MSTLQANPIEEFHWEPQPQAERFVHDIVDECLAKNPFAAALAQRMKAESGTRFADWVGLISLPTGDQRLSAALEAGFAEVQSNDGLKTYRHSGGMFPDLVVGRARNVEVGIKVEFVTDFLAANGLDLPIEGEPMANLRIVKASEQGGVTLLAIERRGLRSWRHSDARAAATTPADLTKRLKYLDAFRTRERDFDDDSAGFEYLNTLVDRSIADLGRDLTCDLFFSAEREFWMRRNHAARVQKARQDRLGLGWANHDHHTYRSSRQHFTKLIALHEKLGLVVRERFYAGLQAGWGAQVMEQPVTGIITFNDVDLSPEELFGDFAHEPLSTRDKLGTIGLWCALHGEAMLQAGMHHLECQFAFDDLREQLEKEQGVKTMKAFTDFGYLRQAFTEGERWKVSEKRIAAALAANYITTDQANQFRQQGALGSHLENLERNEGFKGFNQTGVSQIIAATDPRKMLQPV